MKGSGSVRSLFLFCRIPVKRNEALTCSQLLNSMSGEDPQKMGCMGGLFIKIRQRSGERLEALTFSQLLDSMSGEGDLQMGCMGGLFIKIRQ